MKEYDYVIQCERKTEFLTALMDACTTLSGSASLDFATEITVANKGKTTQKISFVVNNSVKSVSHSHTLTHTCIHLSSVRVRAQTSALGRSFLCACCVVFCACSGVSHLADPASSNIVVTVGKLDVVNDAYLRALEVVPMKRTDPSLKPKPGYVARAAPTGVRGISIGNASASASGMQTSNSNNGNNNNNSSKAASASSSSAAAAAASSPAEPAKPKEIWARAVEDFVGSDSRELTFRKGDVLRILSQDESGWWSSEKDGVLGYAPSTYLEVLPAGSAGIPNAAAKKW